MLLHLLVADVRRLSEEAWRRHDGDVVRRCVHRLHGALRTSEDAVQNAVAVSFVEDTGWWDTAMDACLATWPPALAAEAERQRRGDHAP